MADNAISKVVSSLLNEKKRGTDSLVESYETHSGWLSEAISSGKRNFIANNSNGPLNDISSNSNNKRPAPTESSSKKVKKSRDREQSICNVDRASIAAALVGGDDMDFNATDGFGAAIPKANPKRNTILLTELDPMSMVVKDLRRELRTRGLDGNGLKKDLQARLKKHLETEKREMEKIRNNGREAAREVRGEQRPEKVEKSKSEPQPDPKPEPEPEPEAEPEAEPVDMEVDKAPPLPALSRRRRNPKRPFLAYRKNPRSLLQRLLPRPRRRRRTKTGPSPRWRREWRGQRWIRTRRLPVVARAP